jgi:hypothetical protein
MGNEKLLAFKEELNQLYKKYNLALDTDGSNQSMYIIDEENERFITVNFNDGYNFFESELTPQGRVYKEIK